MDVFSADRVIIKTHAAGRRPIVVNGNIAQTLTPTRPPLPLSSIACSAPALQITRVAIATKSWFIVLETNGKDRDTRRLHSITLSSLS